MKQPDQKHLSTDDRKRAIGAAVRSLIAESGFEGLRMRDIAERVGINIATLHYHVPSKEALIKLLTTSLADEFIAIHQKYSRDSLSPLQELQLEFRIFEDVRVSNSELHIVMGELKRRARHDENVAAHVGPMHRYWAERVTKILARGIQDGTFRSDLNPLAGAHIMIGSLVTIDNDPKHQVHHIHSVAEEIIRSFLSVPTKGLSNGQYL
jgi:AcrR family transcriptional regulator